MTKDVKVFWIKWMQRTRYKNAQGKLVIHSIPSSTDEEEVRRKFKSYTDLGYACKLVCADQRKIEAINFENPKETRYAYINSNEQVLEENGRWKLRMKEDQIRQLTNQKAELETRLKTITEKLEALKKED